jgi:cell division protein FtsX
MKILIYVMMALAAVLVVFNTTKLDFENLLVGESSIAFICILAGFCAILLLAILLISKRIEAQVKK